MTIDALLNLLDEKKIRLDVHEQELIVKAPRGALDASLAETLKQKKNELLIALRNRNLPGAPTNNHIGSSRAKASRITPEMVTLVELSQESIDGIVSSVEGGVTNVQDIYPLTPLQEGMLFHHMLDADSDPYTEAYVLAFRSRGRLERFAAALQLVIDRHDILRTGFVWEGLEQPVQVVQRRAKLPLEFIELNAEQGDIAAQLEARYDQERCRLDVRRAPLLRCFAARDESNGRWILRILSHHLAVDHTALELLLEEVKAIEQGRLEQLPTPSPFRNFVAQARLGASQQEHEAFFRSMLGDIDEPTAPFGLLNVQGDGRGILETQRMLPRALSVAIRGSARSLAVSPASVMHLAWALVLARTTGRQDVVFGTVLFGRMQGGAQSDRTFGLFMNTLPVRIRVHDQGVKQCLKDTYALLAQLLRHEHTPLALAQQCSAVPPQMPLFTSLLNYRHSRRDEPDHETQPADPDGELAYLKSQERTNYPLTLSVDDWGTDFSITAQVSGPVAPERVCEFMQTALNELLKALEIAPATLSQNIDVLPQAERRQVLYEWNRPVVEYPEDKCVHELFEEQVARAPDAVAVTFEDHELSYGELNTRANQLAHYLRELGVGPDQLVAICAERSLELVTAILAVLKAGGAYVPLDPAYPSERLLDTLRDSQSMTLLCDAGGRAALGSCGLDNFSTLDLRANVQPWAHASTENLDAHSVGVNPHHLAYVIYTSGSTGKPKGVMVEHANVARLFHATETWFGFSSRDIWTLFHSFSFDFSVWELWGALLYGGRLVIVPRSTASSPIEFHALLCERRVTVLNQTPSAFQQLISAQEQSTEQHCLRHIVFGGEALDLRMLRRWYEQNAERNTQLTNMYGITETTVHVTYCPLAASDAECSTASPIGVRIPDLRVYILDGQMQPVPIGVTGELYVGGAGVARGYLRRPELTAERFLEDSFRAGERVYKSGDLGRWRPDGTIEYLGRNDSQIKIRGFRIELGEIEAKLAQVEGIRDVVVVAREDTPGEKRLVAYYTGQQTLQAEILREEAARNLPNYMVPAAYVHLESLPLTPNGKLDRKALPVPDEQAYVTREYVPPQGELEEALALIWSDLLQVKRIGRYDNFFQLGGHSLLAVQLVSRLRKRRPIDLRDLFENPTLSGLAAVLGKTTIAPAEPLAISARSEQVPLSFAQQRLWFLNELDPTAGLAYHLPVVLRLHGALDRSALRSALDRLVARHEILRTRFVKGQNGRPVQVIEPVGSGFALDERDLRGLPEEERELALRRISRAEANRPFDLAVGPLIRGVLLRLTDNQHALLLTQHHIVSDAWSIGILVREMNALYKAFHKGDSDPLAALEHQFADYAIWQRTQLSGEALEVERQYWRDQLAGIPGLLNLPMDRPRPPVQSYAGDRIEVRLQGALTQKLRNFSQRHEVTLFVTLLSSWAMLMGRLSGQEEVVVGTPVANRRRTEWEGLLGFFVNNLALRVKLREDLSITELLQQVKAMTLAAYGHQELPFEQVVEALEPARSLSHTPIFQVTLSLNNTPGQSDLMLPDLSVSVEEISPGTAQLDLNLWLVEAQDELIGTLEYATALFDRGTVERYLSYWQRLLEGMVEGEEEKVSRLPLLPEAEREQVLNEWNATAAEYPSERCIHELFEEQVEKTPDAVAVVHEGKQLSYRELNWRANRVAHYLVELGIQPDNRVALCVERGLDMVIGLLGILKAGGAYVPLDPGYPTERLAYQLEDSAPVALLTQRPLLERLPAQVMLELLLDEAELAGYPDTNLTPEELGLTPRHLAYVIYTSGSTGAPKGVMLEHRGLCNLAEAQIRCLTVEPSSRVLQFAPLNFDASIWEVVMALCAGASLCLARHGEVLAGEVLIRALIENEITHTTLPPAILGTLPPQGLDSVMTLIVAGEKLTEPLANQWSAGRRLINAYGPTEATVCATLHECRVESGDPPIGRPIANTQIYILDGAKEPVPVGVTGEIYIGGVQVARGYLNQPELTAERFVENPFREGERMYRTGDLGRWRGDGAIEYVGRNDFQVKIRGYRIELGEIEAKLGQVEGVREAVVLAREDVPGDARLVAYYTGAEAPDGERLREQLGRSLPSYMVPGAYVQLEKLPLSPNGKLDRKGLPAPEGEAYSKREYVAPEGEIEETLAAIWGELLGVRQVGRQDNFFELGGHSLLAVSLVERMGRTGLHVDVRALFTTRTLSELAAQVNRESQDVRIPPNLIPSDASRITPDMLTLLELSQESIDAIAERVEGGVANVQDIYPLAPLQEGILFHRLLDPDADPYREASLLGFRSRSKLDRFLKALQVVIDRHDILRTGFAWEGLEQPVQVVWRRARLLVEFIELDAQQGDITQQLDARCASGDCHFDLNSPPLLRCCAVQDEINGRWLLHVRFHHLTVDHTTLEVLIDEAKAIEHGRLQQLSVPVPFRNFVAQARLGVGKEEYEAFFQQMLGDINEPTAPFGLLNVQCDGRDVFETERMLPPALALAIRKQACHCGVTPASLMHLAWALVLARTTGRRDVVFGTVLFGRMQAGADRTAGLFINTLPVRILVDEQCIEQSLKETHALLAQLLRYEHAPLALAQRCSAVPAQSPLFTSLMNYRYSAQPEQGQEDPSEAIEYLNGHERTNYPLTLSVDDLGSDFTITVQVSSPIAPERVCEFMLTALDGLVAALESTPEKALRSVNVLPQEEREQVLNEWNATGAEYPAEKCIHELFEEQVEKTPDAIAVDDGKQRLSYGELNHRANQLGHYLRELGVGPERRVAICAERSLELLIGLLAIWKAGGAYVPLDARYPEERIAYLLSDSGPVVVLCTRGAGSVVSKAWDKTVPLLDLESDAWRWGHLSEDNPTPQTVGLTAGNLAYVIYTSGSTGKPNGVMVEHRSLGNLVSWHIEAFDLQPGRQSSAMAGVGFDASAWEIWPCLCSGASLLMPPSGLAGKPEELLQWWQVQKLDVSFLITPLAELAYAAGYVNAGVGTVLIGGERLKRWPEALPPGQALINNYGPTETTVVATSGALDKADAVLPIGRPIANTQIYILDGAREPVPVGVTGEIYIGGVQVARGYLNRPELTAERFVENRFREGERMYRTGDLGKWRGDGAIEYVGRNDFQVKIRGYRIELGEIEAKLGQVEGVREAVVVAREDVPGDARLVAYYTGAAAPDGESLREQLGRSLPSYMVPEAYVRLEKLPQTPNGKLDRKGLPAPEGEAYSKREYVAPEGEIEETLAAIWRELLGVRQVGRQDNFFELGGHSLLAVQMVSRVRKRLEVELGLNELFTYPELAQLATRIGGEACTRQEAIPKVERGGPLALSLAQQRLWFLTQLEGVSEAYHIGGAVRLSGALEKAALRRALQELVRRHEALRTRFQIVEGQPVQMVEEEAELEIAERDLRGEEKGEEEARRLSEAYAGVGFELERELPVRVLLLQLEEEEHVLQVVMHHIASDGWSVGVFLEELGRLYGAYAEGQESPLEALAIQYADYAAWQRRWLGEGQWERQSEFWRENLRGASTFLELPTDRVRPVEQEYGGASVAVQLGTELSERLKALSQRHGMTLYMTMLASWAAVLSRLSGQEEVVIGSSVAGRNRAEIEGLIGFFVNTLALRVDLRDEPRVDELLGRVKRQVLAAQEHQDLPFDQVVELVKPARSTAHTPLFQVMLDWNNTPEQVLQMVGLRVSEWETTVTTAQFDLTLALQESEKEIVGQLNYATALFDRSTVERYLSYWQRLLEAMVEGKEEKVSRLPLLPEAEREQVLNEWNATAAEYPAEKCIHELFEEQVEKTPDAIAVDDGKQRLSYGELNRRANQLGHYLRDLGVGPERRVAICAERSLEQVIGLLAIWKAGGAYVPLDPEYPEERIAYLLSDSEPVVVLCTRSTGSVVSKAWNKTVPLLDLESDAWRWSHLPEDNPTPQTVGLTSGNLAYVIYTSGSTGKPKGVMIEHCNLVNYTLDAIRWFGLDSGDRVLQQNSLSFDLSLEETMPALLAGATLLPRNEPFGLGVSQELGPSVVHLTAAHWHSLVSEWSQSGRQAQAQLGGVRLINVTGDALQPHKLKEWEAIHAATHLIQTQLINTYGPTESTVSCSAAYVRYEAGASRVSIGKPFANTRLYILDAYQKPVPIGVSGELYISGAGVARGYLNRADLTAERFMPDPFQAGQRMYKSGDLARWLPNGEIEFIGRNDFQVKVRGFRIELGEIEAKLAQVEGVREAVVLVREDAPGDQRLVAYYSGEQVPEAEKLREQMVGSLPQYMVPAAYVYLPKLPLTPNGKLDRKALPRPDSEAYATRIYEAPQTETEQILAGIWADLLKVEQVGRQDNFFDLGGHSLLAISLIERMRREDLRADVSLLFSASTLADLAAATNQLTEIML